MGNIISRDIIADYINYHGYNKEQLCLLINRWKRLLVSKGAKKGTGLGVMIVDLNYNHIALMFAAGELGLPLTIMSKPISFETITATKQYQLGLPEIMVTEKPGSYFWPEKILNFYRDLGITMLTEIEIEEITDDTDFESEEVYPTDPYLMTSTSGTTGPAKKIELTHENILKWSREGGPHLRYSRETTMMHNVNMHHAAAIAAAILPGLMVIENNYYGLINIGTEEQYIVDYVIGKGVKTMMATNIWQIDRLMPYIEKHKDKFNHKLEILIGGFKAPDILYDYAKNLPVTFWTSYASTEHGLIAWFVIDDKTENVPNYVGELVDWISIDFDGDTAYATSERMGYTNLEIPDKIEIKGNGVYFIGRKDAMQIEDSSLRDMLNEQCDYSYLKSSTTNRKYIVLWDLDESQLINFNKSDMLKVADAFYVLKKEDFTVETKVASGELLHYLDNRYDEEQG